MFNLLLQEERVTRLIDEGHTVDLAYLNFAKPFDSVNRQLNSPGIDEPEFG